jgi:F-type H+-transporting ATPase subunit delta
MALAHRVYAEALLEAARGHDEVPQVREEFDDLVESLSASQELQDFLRNPQIEPGSKRDVLEDLLEGSNERFLNFVRLLVDKGRIAELEEVHEEWERLLAREERLLELDLTTAIELTDEEAAGIVKQIEQASGRRVVATRSVDPNLIGGIVIQAGSRRIDASVRGRLNQLRQELTARS